MPPTPKTLIDYDSTMLHAHAILGFAVATNKKSKLNTIFSKHTIDKLPFPTSVPLYGPPPTKISNPTKETLALIEALQGADTHAYFHASNHAAHTYNFCKFHGVSDDRLDDMYYGSLLHDIGKIFFKELVALPRKLTPDEFSELHQHTVVSFIILAACKYPNFVAWSGLFHHLSYDQSHGYPQIDANLIKTIEFISKEMSFPIPAENYLNFSSITREDWDALNILVLTDALDASIDPHRAYKSSLLLSNVAADFETSSDYGWKTMFNPSLKTTFMKYLEWLLPYTNEKA